MFDSLISFFLFHSFPFPFRLGKLVFCNYCSRIVQQDLHDDTFSLTPFHWFWFQYGSNSFIEYLIRKREKRRKQIVKMKSAYFWEIMLMSCFNAIRNDNRYIRIECGGQTCFSPRCVSAEHSIYFTALILLANFWPCSRFNGDKPCSDKALNVSLSSLKSIFVPIQADIIRNNKHVLTITNGTQHNQRAILPFANSPTKIIGASGQWCFISGYHFDVTFSNEDGLEKKRRKYLFLKIRITLNWHFCWLSYLATLKQTRNTSVCGYDKGRNRS